MKPTARGFSLIELIVVLAVLAILLAAGASNFSVWMTNSRIRTTAESIQNGLQMARAEAVRRKTYDRLAAERIMVAGYHFPFPGAAFLEKQGDGYRYQPVYWRPVL